MFRTFKKIWSLESGMYGSRIWENIRLLYMGDTKPLYYLIEYNRLDLLIAVKNKNIDDDLM